jgi:2'-5' RNA ligase
MRLFVAISVSDAIKNKVTNVLDTLQRAAHREGADIKWVQPHQMHFTLKFLGECPDNQLPEIEEALKTAVEGVSPFTLQLGGLGAFPEQGSPRILWVGAVEGGPAMIELAGRVASACERLGFPQEERRFSAHLTLGRARRPRHMGPLRSAMAQIPAADLGSITVQSIELIRSVLSSKGPAYTTLKEFTF